VGDVSGGSCGVGVWKLWIRTLHGNQHAALGLDHLRDHVVDQTVLVPQALGLKLLPVRRLVDFLENVLEVAVVLFEDGVLGRHVHGQLEVERVLERGVREALDALGGVVLRLRDAALVLVGELEDLDRLGLAALGREDGAAQVVPNGAVGRQPHLLELELLDALLVRGDGGALDADAVFLDGLGGVQGDLVVGLVAVGQAQVVVLEVDVQVRVDELVLDVLPDDAGHLVAVQLDDGVLDLDLGDLGSHGAAVGDSCGDGS
jgi:hypothetical protein